MDLTTVPIWILLSANATTTEVDIKIPEISDPNPLILNHPTVSKAPDLNNPKPQILSRLFILAHIRVAKT